MPEIKGTLGNVAQVRRPGRSANDGRSGVNKNAGEPKENSRAPLKVTPKLIKMFFKIHSWQETKQRSHGLIK